MHLIYRQPNFYSVPVYHNETPLTRPGSLPHIFRNLRIHRNLTRASLAKKFNISEKYIQDVEDGSKFPSLKYCLMCAQEFGANPNWVKNKWANERVSRFSMKLRKRLSLDD